MINRGTAPYKVVVPDDDNMALEPAITIAQTRALIAGVIGLLATVGVQFAPGLPEQIDNLVTVGAPILTGLILWWNSRSQGQDTRAAVFSPAQAAALAKKDPDTVFVTSGQPKLSVLPNPNQGIPKNRVT